MGRGRPGDGGGAENHGVRAPPGVQKPGFFLPAASRSHPVHSCVWPRAGSDLQNSKSSPRHERRADSPRAVLSTATRPRAQTLGCDGQPGPSGGCSPVHPEVAAPGSHPVQGEPWNTPAGHWHLGLWNYRRKLLSQQHGVGPVSLTAWAPRAASSLSHAYQGVGAEAHPFQAQHSALQPPAQCQPLLPKPRVAPGCSPRTGGSRRVLRGAILRNSWARALRESPHGPHAALS